MNTNKNMNNVIKQAQKMQEEMERVQAELEEKTVDATSGGGAVSVTANGKKEIVSLKINPEAVVYNVTCWDDVEKVAGELC